MIDADLIDKHDSATQVLIREAILNLTITGVLKAQRERLFAQIAEGSESEDPEKLAERIRTYRWKAHALLALEQQGESIRRDIENERDQG